MKRSLSVFYSLLVLSIAVVSQDKLLTLDDIYSADASKRVAFGGRPTNVSWAADGKSFKEVRSGKLMRVDAVTGNDVPYYDSDKLANALQAAGGLTANEAQRLANSTSLDFNKSETAILINTKGELWHWDTMSGALKRLTNNKDQ